MEPGMESSGGHGRRGMHLQRMLGGLVVVVVANKKQKQVSAEQFKLQVGVFVFLCGLCPSDKNLGFRFRFPQCVVCSACLGIYLLIGRSAEGFSLSIVVSYSRSVYFHYFYSMTPWPTW